MTTHHCRRYAITGAILAAFVLAIAVACAKDSAPQTPAMTPAIEPASTAERAPTPAPTDTATAPPARTLTPAPTDTATAPPTSTPARTLTPAPTDTAAAPPTSTPARTPTPAPTDTATAPPTPARTRTPTPAPTGNYTPYFGGTSLKERIAKADVIARVRLQSVAAGSERVDWKPATYTDSRGVSDPVDTATLEFRFTVLEYLKGSGGTEIVGVVASGDYDRESIDTAADGRILLDWRDPQWDGREAIVFLLTDHPYLLDMPSPGRYLLGGVYLPDGVHGDGYTIGSPHNKTWLPAATADGATGQSDEQRFLLDKPSDGATGQSGAPMITLTDLKTAVAGVEREIASGGGTPAYRECIVWKYTLERMAEHTKISGQFPYKRFDESMASGQPAGTLAHVYLDRPVRNPKPGWGEYRLVGRDLASFPVACIAKSSRRDRCRQGSTGSTSTKSGKNGSSATRSLKRRRSGSRCSSRSPRPPARCTRRSSTSSSTRRESRSRRTSQSTERAQGSTGWSGGTGPSSC